MTYLALLTQSCTVQRCTRPSEDDWGQGVESWADLATGVACRLSAAKGREVTDEAKQVTVRSDRLYLPDGTDVTERDRVVLESLTYQVVATGEMKGRGGNDVRFADLVRVV